jgi:hypothetical protein
MLVLPEKKKLELRVRFRCVRGTWCIVQRFWESYRSTSTPFLRYTISLSELTQSGGKKKGEIVITRLDTNLYIYRPLFLFPFFFKCLFFKHKKYHIVTICQFLLVFFFGTIFFFSFINWVVLCATVKINQVLWDKKWVVNSP